VNDADRTIEVRRAIRAVAPNLAVAMGCSVEPAQHEIRAAIGSLDEFSELPLASIRNGRVQLEQVKQ